MSKQAIPYIPRRAKGQARLKKDMSHGTYRCKRHPNSKRCQSA
jgi:hypothetical protein